MKDEPVRSKKDSERSGPQGTQVFSRDQIADILDDDDAPSPELPPGSNAGAVAQLEQLALGKTQDVFQVVGGSGVEGNFVAIQSAGFDGHPPHDRSSSSSAHSP